jgi:hypothetical protein
VNARQDLALLIGGDCVRLNDCKSTFNSHENISSRILLSPTIRPTNLV